MCGCQGSLDCEMAAEESTVTDCKLWSTLLTTLSSSSPHVTGGFAYLNRWWLNLSPPAVNTVWRSFILSFIASALMPMILTLIVRVVLSSTCTTHTVLSHCMDSSEVMHTEHHIPPSHSCTAVLNSTSTRPCIPHSDRYYNLSICMLTYGQYKIYHISCHDAICNKYG